MPSYDEKQDLPFCRALICLLCQRSFSSRSTLVNHISTSPSHLKHLSEILPRITEDTQTLTTIARKEDAQSTEIGLLGEESRSGLTIDSSLSSVSDTLDHSNKMKKRPRSNYSEDSNGYNIIGDEPLESQGGLVSTPSNTKRRMLRGGSGVSDGSYPSGGIDWMHSEMKEDQVEPESGGRGLEFAPPIPAQHNDERALKSLPGIGIRMMRKMGYDGGALGATQAKDPRS
jgi:hypothetical protein